MTDAELRALAEHPEITDYDRLKEEALIYEPLERIAQEGLHDTGRQSSGVSAMLRKHHVCTGNGGPRGRAAPTENI